MCVYIIRDLEIKIFVMKFVRILIENLWLILQQVTKFRYKNYNKL